MNELTDGKTQTIKIGGTTYEIERMLDLFDDDKTIVMGDIDQTAVKIKITAAPCVAPVRKQQELIHEILHAIFFEVGYEGEIDEKLIKRLSMVMYQVVKENDLADLLDQVVND